VGKAVVQFFRARDRNKDDAVDIVPADDPGLPNGAELLPVCVCVRERAELLPECMCVSDL